MKCETNLSSGINKIKETKKPGMVIIHKSTCSACISLKPKLLASKEIERLSNFFIVISLMDDFVPIEPKYNLDGKYYPRIIFLNTSVLKTCPQVDKT
ncbi:thioredoxin domain-containing protein 12 precursor, putative [Pediculus humanus corporis]|uniref:Thioredoxin domain-containing protein 12, putative n=1 Tax=Pediculus humanus subsp. corporis TaxID=121224 RepID=E0W0R6_PEDHC|nr:thioredoxin domain-containing protein 12 precursor, putative [Pediculus humanus corporis]EEB19222.1 thioredoxin domain-containing protein 12 precursor, putative [Pediculus humanus corporis]